MRKKAGAGDGKGVKPGLMMPLTKISTRAFWGLLVVLNARAPLALQPYVVHNIVAVA